MKMKKIVALVTASALCLGMSMTVMADYSINDDNLVDSNRIGLDAVTNANPNGDYEVDLTDVANGTLQEVLQKHINIYRKEFGELAKDLTDEEIAARLENIPEMKPLIEKEVNKILDALRDTGEGNQERLEIFRKDGYVLPSGDVEAVVLATADLTAKLKGSDKNMTDEEFKERFPNGMTQQINIGDLVGQGLIEDANDLGIGDTIYVLHYDLATGAWETIPATVESVGGDAWITVNFKSLSPIGIVKVMSNNKVIALNKAGKPITDENGNIPVLNNPNKNDNSKNDNTKKATTTTTLGKSPKTGEF